jgi:hypothetical protein
MTLTPYSQSINGCQDFIHQPTLMKRILQSVATLSALSVVMIIPALFSSSAAHAEGLQTLTGKQGMAGHYIGAGLGGNVHNWDEGQGSESYGGNVQGRYQVPNSALSVRGSALINNNAAALVPMLSLDVPVTNNANLYVGGGYSFITERGQQTALGNQDALTLATGVEAVVQENVVLFGDAKVAFDAYRNTDEAAFSLLVGAGYRF